MLWKVLGREPKRNVWDQWPAWAELCFNVLFFVVLVALAYGASTGGGAALELVSGAVLPGIEALDPPRAEPS